MMNSLKFTALSENETNSTVLNLSSMLDQPQCIVYVSHCDGRLGNRMFLMATAYGLARLHSCHLYLSREFLDDIKSVFNVNISAILISTKTFKFIFNKTNDKLKIRKYVQCHYFHELTRPNAISKGQIFHLTGFWQSYLHFINDANELRYNIFVGTPTILTTVSRFFSDIYRKKFSIQPEITSKHHHILKQQLHDLDHIVWIGIHIRRTDFFGLGFSSSDEYIFTAMKYFTEHYPDAHFIVASDDKSYCQKLFQNHSNVNITFNSFSVADDMITLSLCEHSIVTTGTFGWWAGFLAGGKVYHDRIYPSGCEKREHYYPPWYLIDGYVRAHKNSNFSL